MTGSNYPGWTNRVIEDLEVFASRVNELKANGSIDSKLAKLALAITGSTLMFGPMRDGREVVIDIKRRTVSLESLGYLDKLT